MPAQTFHAPARFRVVVSGQLDPRTVSPFCLPEAGSDPRSGVVSAWFEDASALQGLLDRFRDLAIPLVSLNPVEVSAGARAVTVPAHSA